MIANLLKRLALAAGLATLVAAPVVLMATSAQAQFFGDVFGSRFAWGPRYYDEDTRAEPEYAPRGLAPGAVSRMLANEGYRLTGPLGRRGRVYLANVADRETGQHERLVIDAFSGDVLESYPLTQRIAPPANVTRVPRADVPDPPRPSHRSARLAPSGPDSDPLVVTPGEGGSPKIIRPKSKPAPSAKAPRKPKPVIARRSQPETPKALAPVTPSSPAPVTTAPPPPPALPSATAPSNPLSLPADPANAAAPAPTPDPTVAASPPAAPLPIPAPIAAPQPTAATPPPNVDFVAPLDDATPAPKSRPPVNDVPVAPLE